MKRKGFALVELLIVLSIIAMMFFIVASNYDVWKNNVKVKEAAYQLASDLDRQRTHSKRFNNEHKFVLANDGKSYTLNGKQKIVTEGITIVGPNEPLTFYPPYGIVDKPLQIFEVRLDANAAIETGVRVVGIVGKVIVE